MTVAPRHQDVQGGLIAQNDHLFDDDLSGSAWTRSEKTRNTILEARIQSKDGWTMFDLWLAIRKQESWLNDYRRQMIQSLVTIAILKK